MEVITKLKQGYLFFMDHSVGLRHTLVFRF